MEKAEGSRFEIKELHICDSHNQYYGTNPYGFHSSGLTRPLAHNGASRMPSKAGSTFGGNSLRNRSKSISVWRLVRMARCGRTLSIHSNVSGKRPMASDGACSARHRRSTDRGLRRNRDAFRRECRRRPAYRRQSPKRKPSASISPCSRRNGTASMAPPGPSIRHGLARPSAAVRSAAADIGCPAASRKYRRNCAARRARSARPYGCRSSPVHLDDERTDVVDPMRMIGMRMRHQDGVEAVDRRLQQLRAQIGRHVDRARRLAAVALALEQDRAAPPAVLRIVGIAGAPALARRAARRRKTRIRGS